MQKMSHISGSYGNNGGRHGEDGTVTGKKCPKGVYSTFCNECPNGTYKDVDGSEEVLCFPCSLELLPHRADFIYVGGGVSQPFCPYKCISDTYRMPNWFVPLEELIYTFGGPWTFAVLLSFILVLLSLLLSTLRIKLVGSDYAYRTTNAIESHSCHHFPHLLSLAGVCGTGRAEDSQCHVHRMHFMGLNHSIFRTLHLMQLLILYMKMLSIDLLMKSTLLLHMSGGKGLCTTFFQCLLILVPGLGNSGVEEIRFTAFGNMSNQNMIIHVFALADHELFTKE